MRRRKKLSDEHKKKLSIALKGRKKPPFTDAHRKKLSDARKNIVISDETRKK